MHSIDVQSSLSEAGASSEPRPKKVSGGQSPWADLLAETCLAKTYEPGTPGRRILAGGGRRSALAMLMLARLRFAAFLARRGTLGGPGELDDRDRRGVAAAHAVLDHPGVTARTLLEARRDLVEQLFDRAMRSQEGIGAPMGGEVAALAQRHHPVGPAPQLLGLGVSGFEPAVLDKAQHQVAHQSLAMGRGAIELAARVKVTHR